MTCGSEVLRGQCQLILPGYCRDPEVIVGDGLPSRASVNLGGVLPREQNHGTYLAFRRTAESASTPIQLSRPQESWRAAAPGLKAERLFPTFRGARRKVQRE